MKMSLIFALAALILPVALSASGSEKSASEPKARFDYSDYGRVLKSYVTDGWVDYKNLKKNSADLNSYLDSAAAIDEDNFEMWPVDDQLTFYIKLSNTPVINIKTLFSLTTPYKLTNSWYQNIHGSNSFIIIIKSHIESFNILGVVDDY